MSNPKSFERRPKKPGPYATALSGSSYRSDFVRDSSGVDRTLIREMLRLTPEERVRACQNSIRTIAKLRTGGR